MKRKIVLVIVFLFTIRFTTVFATPFSAYLPGGINYIEQDNVIVLQDSIATIDPIFVHGGQDYVLWFPPNGMWGYPYVTIQSEGIILLEGYANDLSDCVISNDYTYCTFQPSGNDIEFSVQAQGIGQYYDYYGLTDIQLEEGTTPSTYEPYIPPFFDVNGPEFSGSATFVKSYLEQISIQDIIDNHILVLDDIEGDVTSSIQISNDTYTENMNTVGQYSAVLTASDSSGNETSMTLYIVVKDEIHPIIDGPTNVTVSVDDPPPVETIISDQITVYDDYDGPLSYVIVTDIYSAANMQIGTYPVTLYTEDASGNTATKTITIEVVDMVAPTLNSPVEYVIELSNPMTLADIMDNVVVSDNYDLSSSINIDIITDEFSANATVVGVYSLVLEITDTSGNYAVYPITITVEDDVAPTISGPTTISTSYTIAPSLSDILDQVSITDNVDEYSVNDLVIELDTYSTRTSEVGTYQLHLSITDSAGNYTTHEITITLLDDQGPTIYVDNYLVTVTSQASFQPEDALNMMIQNNEIEEDEYTIVTLKDEYTGHETEPGIYTYQLQFINSKGESFEKEFLIRVTTIEEIEEVTIGSTIRYILSYGSLITIIGFVVYRMKK